jgi:hypothetical protein
VNEEDPERDGATQVCRRRKCDTKQMPNRDHVFQDQFCRATFLRETHPYPSMATILVK